MIWEWYAIKEVNDCVPGPTAEIKYGLQSSLANASAKFRATPPKLVRILADTVDEFGAIESSTLQIMSKLEPPITTGGDLFLLKSSIMTSDRNKNSAINPM